jgi:hypothetical protein
MSWYRAHFVDVWPDIASFSSITNSSCLQPIDTNREENTVPSFSDDVTYSNAACAANATDFFFISRKFTIYSTMEQ